MSSVDERGQSLSPGNLVMLFKLELTGITPLYFVKRSVAGDCSFGGVEYTQLDIAVSGFKWDGQGSFPTPKLSVSNVAGLLTPVLLANDYLVGARVTVITTYEEFLDGMPNADPEEMYPPEIYTIEQPTEINKTFVEWRLSSIIDQTGTKVPARTMLRDVCNLKYRVPDGSGDFMNFVGECPYVGTAYFNEKDVATTAALDKCSHRESGCVKRFGRKVPMSAFPGISRKQAY